MDKVEKFKIKLMELQAICIYETDISIRVEKSMSLEKELIKIYEEEVNKNENINK